MKRWTVDDWAEAFWLLVFVGLIVGVALYALLTGDNSCRAPDC